MPAAEVDVTVELVEALIRDQRPDLESVEITLIGFGWDNYSYRVGERLVARLPRREMAVGLVENEARWLPSIAPRLPLAVPVPEFVGEPGHGYPWPWTLVRFIPGVSAATSDLDHEACARDLGSFLRALHHSAPADAPPNPFRGVPLRERDGPTRERIEQLDTLIGAGRAGALWDEALAVPEFDAPPVWIHGDLHPNNLLTIEGRLSGVIDFGDITAGDPATDLAVAWTLFAPGERDLLRDAYGGVDDTTWARAQGWALSLATAYLAHSADNPTMAAIGSAAIGRLLS